jgi:hypothetical protein
MPYGSDGLADKELMKFVALIALLISSSVLADWKIGEQKLEIAQCPNGSCLISKDCLEKTKPICLALKASQNRQKSDVGPGGTNPGSSVCSKFHKAGVVLAMNDEGGTNAFCRFSDGSLLSLDGLWHW